jgi:hypothetical protein
VRQRWVVLIGGICLLGLFSAGCGGGSDTSSGPTKAAFLKQVNAACAKTRKKAGKKILHAYETAKVQKASEEAEGIKLEVQVFVPILLEAAKADIAKIRSVGAPPGDQAQVNSIVKNIEGWITQAENTPLQVVVSNNIFNDARTEAEAYGLTECATTPFEE